MAEDFYVITFKSSHVALWFEKASKEAGLGVKLIPVPRQISSSCGLAGRFQGEVLPRVIELCQQHGIVYEDIYRIEGEKGREPAVITRIEPQG